MLDHRTKTTQWVNSNTQEKDRLTDFQPKEVFHKDIFRSRVQYDIEHNDVTRADWQTILVIAGSDGDPWDTFNTWLKRLKQPSKKLLENVSSDFMESIVRLAFYYDQINSVASILSHMPLPPEKFIRDFANIIQDQCTAFPLAIDENVLNKWITSVRKCVNKTGFINEYEVIHGALKTQLLHAHTTPSIHLVEKLFDLKIKDGWSPDIPPKTKIEICKDIIVDTQVIGKKIKAVYVSQVDLEETEIIFCTIDGHQFENEKYSQEVYCKKICQTYEWELATINKNGRERLKGGRCAIPGNEALDHLKKTVKKILELASKLIGDCPEIVYFSPSPDWINAPWQYLFYTAATANSKSLWPIISIVPSLVWMQAAFSHLSPKKHLEYCISQETDLADAAAKLDKLYPPNTEAESSISQYIVFGHGQPPTLTTPFATINAPNSPFTIDRWIEASGFDAYILHACSCAKIMPLFAGTDYGGAPGLLLLLKGKVILAPCIEIHPDVALTLQSEIFEQMKQPHCTYADAYRAAVDKDERCLFYTIFGLATLPLMSKSCDFDK